ncbi:cytochrome P450 [Dactylonectria macrodidyma]|uniref:Cytochrome P450 n=1 Tax=Dactylonectria macrodidyma TaxID=307937 RepID=A0A9P9DKD3_9HYPO|nr:cytochrome P450 [Dactylonectria macrodidyma]
MDRSFGAVQDPNTPFQHHYDKLRMRPLAFNKTMLLISMFTIGFAAFFQLPTKWNRESHKAAKYIRNYACRLVEEMKGKMQQDDRQGKNIASLAMASGAFSDQNMVDQIQLPAALSPGTTVRAAEIDSLPYLNAFCNEVLRFYPPVPSTVREARVDTFLAGSFIPKGTTLLILPGATNLDQARWGLDAEEFNPDRWLGHGRTNNGGSDSNLANLTVLAGPQGCIGKSFAVSELLCLVAVLVSRFQMQLQDPDKALEIVRALSAAPMDVVCYRQASLNLEYHLVSFNESVANRYSNGAQDRVVLTKSLGRRLKTRIENLERETERSRMILGLNLEVYTCYQLIRQWSSHCDLQKIDVPQGPYQGCHDFSVLTEPSETEARDNRQAFPLPKQPSLLNDSLGDLMQIDVPWMENLSTSLDSFETALSSPDDTVATSTSSFPRSQPSTSTGCPSPSNAKSVSTHNSMSWLPAPSIVREPGQLNQIDYSTSGIPFGGPASIDGRIEVAESSPNSPAAGRHRQALTPADLEGQLSSTAEGSPEERFTKILLSIKEVGFEDIDSSKF